MTQIKKIDYAALQRELDTIVDAMQRVDGDIDASLKNYARGLAIIAELEAYLQTAENSVHELKASFSKE